MLDQRPLIDVFFHPVYNAVRYFTDIPGRYKKRDKDQHSQDKIR
jgi:hypothetical protein